MLFAFSSPTSLLLGLAVTAIVGILTVIVDSIPPPRAWRAVA
jgi:hypothetical protein